MRNAVNLFVHELILLATSMTAPISMKGRAKIGIVEHYCAISTGPSQKWKFKAKARIEELTQAHFTIGSTNRRCCFPDGSQSGWTFPEDPCK